MYERCVERYVRHELYKTSKHTRDHLGVEVEIEIEIETEIEVFQLG